MIASLATAQAAQLFNVVGRTYIVTGAASGLGLAIAEVLAANGGRLLLLDCDEKGLKDLASRLQASVASQAVDVADADALRQAVDAFISETGRIDGMFANAGISGGAGFGTNAGNWKTRTATTGEASLTSTSWACSTPCRRWCPR